MSDTMEDPDKGRSDGPIFDQIVLSPPSYFVPNGDPGLIGDGNGGGSEDTDNDKSPREQKILTECDTLIGGGESKDLKMEDYNKMENKVGEKKFGADDCDEDERTSSFTVSFDGHSDSLPISNNRPVQQKPGVILLGRGNSFSLGRSEVILLHNRPKSTSRTNRKSRNRNSAGTSLAMSKNENDHLITIDERRFSVDSDDVLRLNVTGGTSSDGSHPVPSPSPPPVSNGLHHPDGRHHPGYNDDSHRLDDRDDNDSDDGSGDGFIQLVPCYEDDLQHLWLKAEAMMTQRNDRVRKILEEFGIGEPGGGGGEDETFWEDEENVEGRKKEEEEVWQMIQDS